MEGNLQLYCTEFFKLLIKDNTANLFWSLPETIKLPNHTIHYCYVVGLDPLWPFLTLTYSVCLVLSWEGDWEMVKITQSEYRCWHCIQGPRHTAKVYSINRKLLAIIVWTYFQMVGHGWYISKVPAANLLKCWTKWPYLQTKTIKHPAE